MPTSSDHSAATEFCLVLHAAVLLPTSMAACMLHMHVAYLCVVHSAHTCLIPGTRGGVGARAPPEGPQRGGDPAEVHNPGHVWCTLTSNHIPHAPMHTSAMRTSAIRTSVVDPFRPMPGTPTPRTKGPVGSSRSPALPRLLFRTVPVSPHQLPHTNSPHPAEPIATPIMRH